MDREIEMIEISTPRKGILQIMLNRPEVLNALSHTLMKKLYTVLLEARRDSTIRAVLITGKGKAFCAGADIRELSTLDGQSGLQFAKYGQQVFRMLETLGKPSLAAIHGAALGGGLELAMAATLRLAAAETVIGQPEVKLGVIPGFGGTQRLSRLAGRARAMEWCLTGRKVAAAEALAAGVVNEVVPASQLLERALEVLAGLVQLAPIALQHLMTVTLQGYDLAMEEALELEAAHFALCCATKDKQEGVKAFIEKREAVFAGE